MPATRPRGRPPKAKHLESFLANLADVKRLLEIHTEIAGPSVGQKHRVEVLNKTGIVLVVACWESFVEDLAELSFGLLLRKAKHPEDIPQKVRALVAKHVREEKDERRIWDLAGDGWRGVFQSHKTDAIAKFTGHFHTPKPGQIDELFSALLGLQTISKKWSWHRCPPAKARLRLTRLVVLRGAIAHRVSAPQAVHKKHLVDAIDLVQRLAVATHAAVNANLGSRFGFPPWRDYEQQAG